MQEGFIDNDLGDIIIRRNIRAKSVIARKKEDHILLTVPSSYSLSQTKQALEQMKTKLIAFKAKPKLVFDYSTSFKSLTFELNLIKGSLNNYYTNLRDGILSISIPANVRVEDKEVQLSIRKLIETALRSEAKRILPDKLKYFAAKYGFEYNEVKINKSRTRWGSCSHTKNINLSYFCLLLPAHLIDLVILHELCHTREMNHSKNFWAQVDRVTEGQAQSLNSELKKTRINW